MSPYPMEKEKSDGTLPRAAEGRKCPAPPLGPSLSPPQQLREASNRRHSKTGSETTWCSWSELQHHRPMGLQLVLTPLRAAPVHQHPPEPGPPTCSRPDTWGRLQQAQDWRFPLPGTTQLARAWSFGTPVAPQSRRPSRTSPDPPTDRARPLSTPLPSPAWRGAAPGPREQYRWPHGYCPPRG